jgi:hypothetical protein
MEPLSDTKQCSMCNISKDLESFSINKRKLYGRDSRCKECRKIAYQANRTAILEKVKEYNRKNTESIKYKKTSRYLRNKDELNTFRRAKRELNKVEENVKQKKRRSAKKTEVYNILGSKCAVCSVTDVDVLCIDHVNNDGYLERINKNYQRAIWHKILNGDDSNYQLLCFNCNLIKAIEYNGVEDKEGYDRLCRTCLLHKPSSNFKAHRKYPDGLYYECNRCTSSRSMELRVKALNVVGSVRCICGYSDPRALTIDHVNGNASADRQLGLGNSIYLRIIRRKASTSNYMVLCMNCNHGKYVKYGNHLSKYRESFDNSLPSSVEAASNASPKQYEFKDLTFSEVTASECIPLFEQEHYAGYGRHGKIVISAKCGEDLVVCAKFSSPIRKEVATKENFNYDETLELDRLVVSSPFRKKNLLSYCLSRIIKIIRTKYPTMKAIFSFADSSANHHGGVYYASNWKYLGKSSRSYCYLLPDGKEVHKKTLYNEALRNGMIESEYASFIGAKKYHTNHKHKFMYLLQ